ncbi:hypothetical protein GGH12_003056 [Coemansia sp. RSA 1822]|nr:hypothetical protein LPJ76_002758 [Coemansia sp. RSA 638]KAJ2562669.1 hypothetical protein GGH12_003056 [Coemansia sp. RSA 1822]
MAGILLESGVVLVPLACAALYVIVMSNVLLTVFGLAAVVGAGAVYRLRYHYSSGARTDLIATSKHSNDRGRKQTKEADILDRENEDFREIVQDAQEHCDGDSETIQSSGALLSEATTSDSAKYDMEKHGGALSYDHRCFYIDGRATWVLATDFDYWRLPIALSAESENAKLAAGIADAARDTWKRALLQLKTLGFNAVRIRFHWGFHSPSKGKYNFTGSRDVGSLLALCEELNILVIACVGPFIGSDVQGGGYPFWLIQRDHIRLRHLWRSAIKLWDNRFAAAEAEWFDKIISILTKHEIVTKNAHGRGCVVVVQLENHLGTHSVLGLPLALHDETRFLARMARERTLRVPLVTNNLNWPGDFSTLAARVWIQIERKLRAYRIIKEPFRADIPGFTVHNIVSTPVDRDAMAQITQIETAPMVALELYGTDVKQNGSFSDQIEFALSQGLSAFSLPGFFKRSCPGNVDSPLRTVCAGDDYAAVAEDGMLSPDARTARLVLYAARALEQQLAASDLVGSRPWILRANRPSVRGVSIDSLSLNAVQVRRQWEHANVGMQSYSSASKNKSANVDDNDQLGIVTYIDGREMPADGERELAFLFSLADAPVLGKGCSFALTGTLGPRRRGIFAANILVGEQASEDPLALTASSKEIYARVALDKDSEAWVCAEEGVQSGQLFFLGKCQVSGHAEVEVVDVEHAKGHKFSFVIPKPGPGVFKVTSDSGVSVTVALLSQVALDTLAVGYGAHSRVDAKNQKNVSSTGLASAVAWGADGLTWSGVNSIDCALSSASAGKHIVAISQQQPQLESGALQPIEDSDTNVDEAYSKHAVVWQFVAGGSDTSTTIESVTDFERRTTSFDSLPWKLLPTMADLETMDEINVMSWQRDLGTFAYQASDLGFNASNVVYRCQVRLKPKHVMSGKILLQLNMRHRCTLWVNGINMSGHQTFYERARKAGLISGYIESWRNPGASAGADRWGGTATFDVTGAMRLSNAEDEEGALNEVIIIVESFGVGTQADGGNDARTPRGLISAYWHGFNFVGEDHDDSEIHDHEHDKRTEQMRAKWEICSVDVTKLSNSFNSSGFPDEATQAGWVAAVEHPLAHQQWSTRVQLNVDAGVQWLRWRLPAAPDGFASEPVFLRVIGRATVYIWANDVLLSKHHPSNTESLVLLRGGTRGLHALDSQVKVMMYGWAEDSSDSTAIPVELSLVNGDIELSNE